MVAPLHCMQPGRCTYCHDWVSYWIAIVVTSISLLSFNTPLVNIPPSVLTLSYQPDIWIFSIERCDICPVHLILQAAWEWKSRKVEYQLLISELDCLAYVSQYFKIVVWVIYLQKSVRSLQAAIRLSAAVFGTVLDKATQQPILSCIFYFDVLLPIPKLCFFLFFFFLICFLMLELTSIKGLWVTCTHSQWKKNHTLHSCTLV